MSISSWTTRLRSPLPWCIPWIANGSEMIEPTVRRGFSDEYGSWKIICISRRSGLSSFVLRSAISRPSNLTEPEVGSQQPEQQPRGGRLAAARLADDAERLAALDVEGDAVDRVHGAELARTR